MTTEEAVRILREMYEKAPDGERGSIVIVFGIKYAAELEGMNLYLIATRATTFKHWGREIRKGVKLARYVSLRGE